MVITEAEWVPSEGCGGGCYETILPESGWRITSRDDEDGRRAGDVWYVDDGIGGARGAASVEFVAGSIRLMGGPCDGEIVCFTPASSYPTRSV
jgi:hypothetical protein